ncbi:MAG: hypothetical protein ABSB35_08875 [Bryobacteraceae bacterium]|jgi:hypothetical protein
MSKCAGFAQLLPISLAVIGTATLSAQTNLLTNGQFENRFAIQTVQTQTCNGQSSAASWNTWINGPCVTGSGLELETDLLLGSTSPFFTLPAHLIHIRAEPMVSAPVGDAGTSGITQVFDPSGLHTRVLTSLWVYVVRGQVGIGAGPGNSFPLTIHNSTMGAWEQLVGVNTSAPPEQFNIYSTNSTGSEFYASNAVVCPADTNAELAACEAFVGAPGSGGQTGTIASLTIVPSTVTGGQRATGTLTLSSPAPSGGVQATLSSNNPAAGVPPSVMVMGGQSSASFPVSTTPVTSTTIATITATSANTVSAELTINPSGNPGGGQPTSTPCVGSLTLSVGSIIGGNSLSGIVKLTAAAQTGETVRLGSSSIAAAVPRAVVIAPGQTSPTFTITTNPVATVETPIISATVGACVSVSATLDVLPVLNTPLPNPPLPNPPLPNPPIPVPLPIPPLL